MNINDRLQEHRFGQSVPGSKIVMCSDSENPRPSFRDVLTIRKPGRGKILTDLVLVWISRPETKIPSLSLFSFKRKRILILSDINLTHHISGYLKSEQSTGMSNWKPQHSEGRRNNGFGKSPILVVNEMIIWIILAQHLQLHFRTHPRT